MHMYLYVYVNCICICIYVYVYVYVYVHVYVYIFVYVCTHTQAHHFFSPVVALQHCCTTVAGCSLILQMPFRPAKVPMGPTQQFQWEAALASPEWF